MSIFQLFDRYNVLENKNKQINKHQPPKKIKARQLSNRSYVIIYKSEKRYDNKIKAIFVYKGQFV